MKTLNLIPIIFFSSTVSFSQDSVTSDAELSSSLVGSWEHVSSTYPGGDITTYHREIELFADGKGICTKYNLADTLTITFEWEVKDSIVYMFVINKNGKRIHTDSQYISLMDFKKMYLIDSYGEEQAGKVCCYRRTDLEIAKY